MTNDRREDILARLQVVLGGVPNVRGVWRDRGVLKQSMAPAILLLDGNETRQTRVEGRGHTQMPPAVFTLKPQIAILLPPRDTVQNLTLGGVPQPIGPDLSAYRVAIIAAVLNDEQIIWMCEPNGLTYDGFTTDMRVGQELGAFGPWMLFMFSFNYTFDASQLVA